MLTIWVVVVVAGSALNFWAAWAHRDHPSRAVRGYYRVMSGVTSACLGLLVAAVLGVLP